MTIDYFMQHIADPNQLYSVGSNSGFFFIGTRSEWNRCIDALSRKRLKYLRSHRTAAKRNAKRAQERLNREPIKLICGKDLEETIAYLNSVVETGNREYLYFDRLIKAFTPFRTREIKDIYKKHLFQKHPFEKEHIIKELGDCCWYIALCAYALDTTLEDIMQQNIDKLRARYPDGFSTDRSLHRDKNDV